MVDNSKLNVEPFVSLHQPVDLAPLLGTYPAGIGIHPFGTTYESQGLHRNISM